MKQIIQDFNSGNLSLVEVPTPRVIDGYVRVKTVASLISAGTEKMIIDLGKKSLLGKAQARPDLVRQVLAKARNEGVINTYHNVKSKLERPMLLGYSAAGVVLEVGKGIADLAIGDRVAMAGAGYANHAEVNVVPRNLVAPIPEGVPFESAAYGTVASIAMQGVRLAKPQIGEVCLVIGLGLIGLITIQILRANGCCVIGIDLAPSRVQLALESGVTAAFVSNSSDVKDEIQNHTNGMGCDHTFVTAATKSNEPIELAGELTRRKGQVVVVGAVGLEVPRDSYYSKELTLQVSMSYGPGRYDPSFEEGGIDYPFEYVRWTEQRNMLSVLELMRAGQLDMKQLTTHEYLFSDALEAYKMIESGEAPIIGVILIYSNDLVSEEPVVLSRSSIKYNKTEIILGLIGAGNYASLKLLPLLGKNKQVTKKTIVSTSSTNVLQKAKRFGFSACATNPDDILLDPEINTVFIAGRHSTHAGLIVKALEQKKHVFVEKPLVVNPEQLNTVTEAYFKANTIAPTALMVGLNRRFAPMALKLKTFFDTVNALQMIYRVNSGFIPNTTWLHEEHEGNGMLVGEMCHFVDLMQFICGASPISVFAHRLEVNRKDMGMEDNLSISIAFSNGSTGVLVYNTVGDKTAPKERVEVFGGGRVALLDDFRRMTLTKNGKTKVIKSANQNKGQPEEIKQTIQMFMDLGQSPIPFNDQRIGMCTVFAIRDSLQSSLPVQIDITHTA